MADARRTAHMPDRTQAVEPSAAQAPSVLDLPVSNEGGEISCAIRQIMIAIQQLLHEQKQLRHEVQERLYNRICQRLHHEHQLAAMRLHNASAHGGLPVRYPPGVPTSTLPATRDGFLYLTGRCSTTMNECEHC